ncbi:MAG: response regulator [Candidatus Omnitrophota bacterium]
MAGNKKVLIVDDEPDILKAAVFRIKKAGYDVIEAVSGKEGLEKAQTEPPDLIMLDWKLPEMDGVEVYLILKKTDRLKDIPVVFFTASKENVDLREKMEEVGAEHVIIKPYEAEELLSKIKELIG